jgi:adenosine kinase
VPIVITTFGKQGSVVEGASLDQPIPIEIAKADQVADPTGAGDSYRAGFLYGYNRGWELKTCAQLAATCASYAIEQAGTQNHSCTIQQIAARYQEQYNQPLPAVQ